MKRLLQMMIVMAMLFIYIGSAYAAAPADIDAGASILIDMKTGQVLYEQNSNRPHMYPASTTKMLTGAIACEKGNPEQVMTASQAAVNDIGKDGMNIGIMPDEQLNLKYLLQALLISSANETANIIAENMAGSRQEFVDMMNAKAKDLGCTGTHFVNPCGAHNTDHYTTAADLAKLARYAMSIPSFREIVKQISYQLPATNKHAEWPVLYTTNKLLRYQKKDAPYTITGIKTGYTGPAGNNLVSSAENAAGMQLIAVVMDVTGDSSSSRVIKYSRELYDYGFSSFAEKQVLQKGQTVQSVPVAGGDGMQTVDLQAAADFKYIAPINTEDSAIQGKPVINGNIAAPVMTGDVLGYIQYEKDGQLLGKVDLTAAASIEKKKEAPGIQSTVTKVKNSSSPLKTVLIVLGIAAIAFAGVRFTLRQISRQLRYKRRFKL